MENTDILTGNQPVRPVPDNGPESIVTYYSEAGMDYETWSPGFNMHFGYFRWGINPFRREAQLEEMNRQVLKRLDLNDREAVAADPGCGTGATARHGVQHFPQLNIEALTIVPWQIKKAKALNAESLTETERDRLAFRTMDYTATTYPPEHFDGAYAVESSCHADGDDKTAFIAEASRILKPGARLVIADGFVKQRLMPRWYRRILDRVCACWALEQFADRDAFVARLQAEGFVDIKIEEIGWRIAPSVLHSPLVITRHIIKQWLGGAGLGHESREHLIACAISPILGIMRKYFGYYLIRATKGQQPEQNPRGLS